MTISTTSVYPELPITNLKRAKDFYQNKLGLKLIEEIKEHGVLVFGAGGDTRIELFESDPPKSGDTAASFKVDDVAAEVQRLKARGVVFEEYTTGPYQTVNGICTIGAEKCAWFKDSEGNILCLNERRSK